MAKNKSEIEEEMNVLKRKVLSALYRNVVLNEKVANLQHQYDQACESKQRIASYIIHVHRLGLMKMCRRLMRYAVSKTEALIELEKQLLEE